MTKKDENKIINITLPESIIQLIDDKILPKVKRDTGYFTLARKTLLEKIIFDYCRSENEKD